jgi:hypothetical protein
VAATISLEDVAGGRPPKLSYVFALDLALSPRMFPASYIAELRELVPWDASRFAAVDDAVKGTSYFDVDSGAATIGVSLLGVQVENNAYLGQVLLHPGSERTVVSVTSETGGIYAFDGARRFLARAGDFGLAEDAWAMAPWPKDPGLVLVGLSGSQGARTASVALVDPVVGRFLPASLAIGRGPPGRMVADAKGRIWVPLPWTGNVVRIAPR